MGEDISARIRLGVAEVFTAEETWDEALLRADHALHEAKAGGRNRVIAASLDDSKKPIALDLDSLLESDAKLSTICCVNT